MRERVVEARLRMGVKKRGGIALKLSKLPGWPDRLILLPMGRVFFVECKRPTGGKLALHQRAAHSLICKLGFKVFVLSNIGDVDSWLERYAD